MGWARLCLPWNRSFDGGIRLSAYRSRGKCLLSRALEPVSISVDVALSSPSPSYSLSLASALLLSLPLFLAFNLCFIFGLKCEAQFFKSYMKLTNFVQAPPLPQLQRSRRCRTLHLQMFTCQLCSRLSRSLALHVCVKATPASDTVRAEADGQRDGRRDRANDRLACPLMKLTFYVVVVDFFPILSGACCTVSVAASVAVDVDVSVSAELELDFWD